MAALEPEEDFNPPTPWGVGRSAAVTSVDIGTFQSTHSVGSGTPPRLSSLNLPTFQSTHSVGSGTHYTTQIAKRQDISIHPLRGEWDCFPRPFRLCLRISIHPLRGEWDQSAIFVTPFLPDFNPPTPWGVGQAVKAAKAEIKAFQSTHSVGSGTGRGIIMGMLYGYFNPPTPWGVGQQPYAALRGIRHFNPPTPWGVGPLRAFISAFMSHFNPPTPWGVGRYASRRLLCTLLFQSTHSVGSGTKTSDKTCPRLNFNPPTPWGVGPLQGS